MSLADIYEQNFGPLDESDMSKEASDESLAAAIDSLTDEEAEKLAQVMDVFDSEGIDFYSDGEKLAAAAEIVDEYDEYNETEKNAEEIDAGGRLFAQAFVDELNNIG